VYFNEQDVVRHRLVQEIIKAYDRHSEEAQDGPADSRRRKHGQSRPRPDRGQTGSGDQPH
jgi:phosphate starvation-inducible PhoH-like protein